MNPNITVKIISCSWVILGVLSGCGSPDCYDRFDAEKSNPIIDSVNLTLINGYGDNDTSRIRGDNERIYLPLDYDNQEMVVAKWISKSSKFIMTDTLYCYRCRFDFAISELNVDSADPSLARANIRIGDPYFVAIPAVIKSSVNLFSSLSDSNEISYSVNANDAVHGHFSFRNSVKIYRKTACGAW